MNNFATIQLNGKTIKPHKAIINPSLSSRTVLTDCPWDFVELWLKREKKENALFYWHQAREFHNASFGLPTQSAPLLHYYSFMNAAKALLAAKNISFNEYHGVSSEDIRGSTRKISLNNEGVKIKSQGILPSLSSYFEETETSRSHSLQELLFNLPYIHRTYCLSYRSQKDMFIPIKDCCYVVDKKNKQVFFRATLSSDFARKATINRLPPNFEPEVGNDADYTIRSKMTKPFSKPKRPTILDKANLVTLHKELRKDLHYINGPQTLWYIKSFVKGPTRLNRYPSIITLAVMHRLSELCRYKPMELASFLSGQKNWLLTEFIKQAPSQFIDEISSEITGHQFLIPNVRAAT